MSKRSEMFSLIAEWESSGLDRSSFCELHDIKVSKFSYWRTRYKKSQPLSPNTTNFVKLQPSLESSVEVIYPNGVKVVLPSVNDTATISALILVQCFH